MTEKELQSHLQRHLNRRGMRLFRNNVGMMQVSQERIIKYGVGGAGAADLIGLRPIVVTEDDVGQTIGQFVALEVKGEGGRESLLQRNFISIIEELGGYARLVNPANADQVIEEIISRRLP